MQAQTTELLNTRYKYTWNTILFNLHWIYDSSIHSGRFKRRKNISLYTGWVFIRNTFHQCGYTCLARQLWLRMHTIRLKHCSVSKSSYTGESDLLWRNAVLKNSMFSSDENYQQSDRHFWSCRQISRITMPLFGFLRF